MRYPIQSSVVGGLALSFAVFSFSNVASAQNPELGDTNYNTTVQTAPATAPAAPVMASGTDHAGVVGHFGVGAFGVLALPYASGAVDPANADVDTTLSAPTIGARYWLDERMAIEGAIGIGYASGSATAKTGNTSVEVSGPSVFGFALHGGLPLVFATASHFAFEVVPELNFGFVSGSQDRAMGGPLSLSGMLLQLGARVGAEIQFGFIDIPQLALQGTVGLHMTYVSRGTSDDNTETSVSNFGFNTTVQQEPWDIFTGNIAAIYYF